MMGFWHQISAGRKLKFGFDHGAISPVFIIISSHPSRHHIRDSFKMCHALCVPWISTRYFYFSTQSLYSWQCRKVIDETNENSLALLYDMSKWICCVSINVLEVCGISMFSIVHHSLHACVQGRNLHGHCCGNLMSQSWKLNECEHFCDTETTVMLQRHQLLRLYVTDIWYIC
jgi:hypothetical protein